MDTRTSRRIEHVIDRDQDTIPGVKFQRRRGVHDLPRRERQGGRRQRVAAAVKARV